LAPADVEDILKTRSITWEQIFEGPSWLDFALTLINVRYRPRGNYQALSLIIGTVRTLQTNTERP
jgi:hypothetical protein